MPNTVEEVSVSLSLSDRGIRQLLVEIKRAGMVIVSMRDFFLKSNNKR
jgi:hypothetical protein